MSFRPSMQRLIKPSRRQLCLRSTARPSAPTFLKHSSVPHRSISSDEKPLPKADSARPGPNQEQLPHVSEEAAATSKSTGETAPDLDQGTPVKEVLERDQKTQESAPKVLKGDEGKHNSPKGSRQYSTSSKRRAAALAETNTTTSAAAMVGEGQGLIFDLPSLPLKNGLHMKRRYEPIVEQITKLMMKDGKLSIAQRAMVVILERLRTAPPPTTNPQRPLIPGSPPASHLPLNPIAFLTAAIDSAAPLLRIKALKGIGGGGASVQIPVPLTVRQRRRTAFLWIVEAANKKADRGQGNGMANKIADELIAIIEGRSSVWEKRHGVHRIAVSARANLGKKLRSRR